MCSATVVLMNWLLKTLHWKQR